MKGTNTLYLNEEQMKDIVQKWWDDLFYKVDGHAVVARVSLHTSGDFEIILNQPPVPEIVDE